MIPNTLHERRECRPPSPLPPGLRNDVARRIPHDLRDDTLQQAWLAHLTGEDPNRAVWRFVKRQRRRRRTVICFSQLDPKTLRRITDLSY